MAQGLYPVLARILEVDPATISEASNMENTDGWTSLRQVILVAEVERIFGVKLDFEQMMEATSVAAIREMLAAKGTHVTG
jgi:acyl carrier protein